MEVEQALKKKLQEELMSLAHQVLRRRNKADTQELRAIAESIYLKMSLLALTESTENGPQPTAFDTETSENNEEVVLTETFDNAEKNSSDSKEATVDIPETTASNLEDFLSQPLSEPNFVKADPDEIAPTEEDIEAAKSIKASGFSLQSNDRLVIVNHLFSGSQEEYLRVLSMLNTKENYEEAKNFLEQVVKPDYEDWAGKSLYEKRFLELLESHFNTNQDG